jgi:hypothetical protein
MLLVVEIMILIIYYKKSPKVKTLYQSKDWPTESPADNELNWNRVGV